MMTLSYEHQQVYLSRLNYQLAKVQRNLDELAAEQLLCNSTATLQREGYRCNFGAGADESLLSLAAAPFSNALKAAPAPRALVVHHSYSESGTLPWEEKDPSPMSRARYFPAALMRHVNLDHVPYFGTFATGCSGFCSMLIKASGLLGTEKDSPVICLTADIHPRGSRFDGLQERVLTSDCGSSFVVGREPVGYQLLGIGHYSTSRESLPLVEFAKRTVQMIRALVPAEGGDLKDRDILIHYPNLFLDTWAMVTKFLKASPAQQVMDGLAERAHCLSSDPIISLAKLHSGKAGRLHVVVNTGSGIHLNVCVLKELPVNA